MRNEAAGRTYHRLSVKIMEFLERWLGDHILGTDKQCEPFFEGKGLK